MVGIEGDPADVARRRVESETVLHSGWISLAGLGLEELPPGLFELTDLRELDLSDNRLGRLPAQFGQLTGLARLSLRGNRLVGLPESLTALTRLRHLDLADNQFAEIPRWLGRLDLESIELGDAAGLVHPPARVVADGTSAVLAYLRERDKPVKGEIVGEGTPATLLDAAVAAPSAPGPSLAPPPAQAPAAAPSARSGHRADASAPVAWRMLRNRRGLTIAAAVTVLSAAGATVAALQAGGSAPNPSAGSAPGSVSGGPQFPTSGAPSSGASSSSAPGSTAHTTAGRTSSPATSRIPGAPVGMGVPMPTTDMTGLAGIAPVTALPTLMTGAVTNGADALCVATVTTSAATDGNGNGNGKGKNKGSQGGSTVAVVSCGSAQATAWTFQPLSGTFQTAGLCLAADSSTLTLATCDGGPEQVFVPRVNGELYNPASGLCATDQGSGAAVPMEACGADGQTWGLPV